MSKATAYKCILLGDAGVGKSHIKYRIFYNAFENWDRPNIEPVYYTKEFNVNNKNIPLQIWDTSGEERYVRVASVYYRGAVGAILVYDITKESFHNVGKWLDEVSEKCVGEVSMVLVGNKFDMAKKRMVSYEEGEEVAKKNGMMFFETSNKTAENVKENSSIKLQGKNQASQYESCAC